MRAALMVPHLLALAALLGVLGCHTTPPPVDGTLAKIKRHQEQRLLLACVSENGGGVTGAVGLAVFQWCRDHAAEKIW